MHLIKIYVRMKSLMLPKRCHNEFHSCFRFVVGRCLHVSNRFSLLQLLTANQIQFEFIDQRRFESLLCICVRHVTCRLLVHVKYKYTCCYIIVHIFLRHKVYALRFLFSFQVRARSFPLCSHFRVHRHKESSNICRRATFPANSSFYCIQINL